MRLAVIALFLSAFIMQCGVNPVPADSKSPLEGNWRSEFQMTYMSPIEENGLDTVDHTSTIIFTDVDYEVMIDPPVSNGPYRSLHAGGAVSHIAGVYQLRADTTMFFDSTGASLVQQLPFGVRGDTLRFSLVVGTDVTPSGDTVVIVVLGGLPWGYAFMVQRPFRRMVGE